MLPFQKIHEIPKSLPAAEIDKALEAFVKEDRMMRGVDPKGYLQGLRDSVASILIFKNSPESFFWLSEHEGKVVAWAMTQIRKGVDNSLCYWMLDAWIAPQYRGMAIAKQWFAEMKADAKQYGCKHILIPSSRNNAAYIRFLGGGFHQYITVLKEDI